MIARFRRRFVAVCMLSVATVLVIILTAVNVVNYRTQVGRVDNMLEFLSENGGKFPSVQSPESDDSDGDSGAADTNGAMGAENDRPLDMNPETRFVTRFFAVTFSGDGAVLSSNVDSIASIGSAEAEEMAQAVYASGSGTGWKGAYRFRVTGSIVVFIDAGSTLDSIRQLLMASCAITASALVVIFLLMMVFSRLAARPVAESLSRQRQFITDASHELKTPLTIISANAEILEMNFGENEWSRSIGKQSERMAKLIAHLIELTRIGEGAKKLALSKFNMSDAVYDTAMAFSTPAERKGLALSVDVTPDVFAVGDEASVRQLVSILMDNAIKYCDPSGDISVTLSPQGKNVQLGVSNTYRDARKLKLDRLFDRFYRADEARTGDGSYGLGLAIAKSLADAQKGQIRAYAEDGRFRIGVRLQGAKG